MMNVRHLLGNGLLVVLSLALLTACVAVGTTPAVGGVTPTPTATEVPAQDVTLSDQGRPSTLHVGESFVLRLGVDYNWQVQVANQDVLSRVPNVMMVRGAQGIYRAHQPGETTLTAIGDPLCRQSNPPCGMPSRDFQVTVVVVP